MTPDGGGAASSSPFLIESFAATLNNSDTVMLEQARLNADRGLPWFQEQPAHDRAMVLVAGGPSLGDELLALRFTQGDVFALNGTHDYLIERGLVPDYMVLLDSREASAGFVARPHPDVTYLLAAVCHPQAFEHTKEHRVILWAGDQDGMAETVPSAPVLVGGGATVGLKALCLGYLWGYRTFHLFGLDSCYRGDEGHAYPQSLNDGEARLDVEFAGRTYSCAPWMAKQAVEFQRTARLLTTLGCAIHVHGEGLLAAVARHMEAPFESPWKGQELRALYDLDRCPASFDFVQWLLSVEMMRSAWGCTGLKVQIKPGPNNGFREDALPETTTQRQRMLDNVMRPALRLVGAEECDDGVEIGVPYLLRHCVALGRAGCRPSELNIDRAAVEWAEKKYPDRPVVVQLREAPYWCERNSSVAEWVEFAKTVDRRVVFVRDTDLACEPCPGVEICPEASLDIHRRAALYRQAACVMGILSGPTVLMFGMETPCAFFMWEIPGYAPWTRDGHVHVVGMEWGGQPPFFNESQRLVYERDTFPAILRSYRTIMKETR